MSGGKNRGGKNANVRPKAQSPIMPRACSHRKSSAPCEVAAEIPARNSDRNGEIQRYPMFPPREAKGAGANRSAGLPFRLRRSGWINIKQIGKDSTHWVDSGLRAGAARIGKAAIQKRGAKRIVRGLDSLPVEGGRMPKFLHWTFYADDAARSVESPSDRP